MPVNIIEFISQQKGINQSEIARRLNVSRAQVSNWKKEPESIPDERRSELNQIADLFGENPDWALFARSEENSLAWAVYLECMQEAECSGANSPKEIGYMRNEDFSWEPNFAEQPVLLVLRDLGCQFPPSPPPFEELTTSSGYEFSEIDRLVQKLLSRMAFFRGSLDHYISRELRESSWHIAYACEQLESTEQLAKLCLRFAKEPERAACGLDETKVVEATVAAERHANYHLSSLCFALSNKSVPLATDYFSLFINTDPMEHNHERADKIEEHFSYFERKMLTEIRSLSRQMEDMNARLEILSSHTL